MRAEGRVDKNGHMKNGKHTKKPKKHDEWL
jgi:hypothetical protein